MNRQQFYKSAAIILLLMNLAIIAFFFLTKPHPPGANRGGDFSRQAIDMLQLDKAQHRSFLQLTKDHSLNMTDIDEQKRALLKPYFQHHSKDAQNTYTDSLLVQIQLLERQKIEDTYAHFQEVETLLHDKQKPHFEKFRNKALEIILMESKGNRPPPGK